MICASQLAMSDLESYVGVPGASSEHRTYNDAPDGIKYIVAMCRKHRFICIGWQRLYEQLHSGSWDAIVAETLDAMNVEVLPDWDALLQAEKVYCVGADSRGIFFRNGKRQPGVSSALYASVNISWLLAEGPEVCAAECQTAIYTDSSTNVKFIGVDLAAFKIVPWKGR